MTMLHNENACDNSTLLNCMWQRYLFSVFWEVVEAEVVDDVPGADEEGGPVHLQQLEVVLVGLVAKKTVDIIWKFKRK